MSDVAVAEETGSGAWVLVLIQGIAAIVIGLLLLFSPVITTVVLVQILGWYFIISGAIGIISLVKDRTMWGLKIFMGIIGILAGIFIVGAPLYSSLLTVAVYAMIIAIYAIVAGAVEIFRAFKGAGWGQGLLGLFNLFIGGYLLMNLGKAALALPWAFGLLAVVMGIVAIVGAFQLKKLTPAAA